MSSGYANTLGAGFISCIFVAILYGITLLQCFIYYQNYKNDSRLLKGTIAGLLILDTLHMFLVAYSLYWYTIVHFDHPEIIKVIPWMLPVGVLIVTPLNGAIIRGWFIQRIWVLSERNRSLVYSLVFLSFAVLGIGIGLASRAIAISTFRGFEKAAWVLYTGLGLLMFVDTCVTATLVWLLYRKRLKTLNERTDTVLNSIMTYTIHTGLLTSILTICCFITYATMPTNYIFLALYLPQSKLYLNTFVASLNARDTWKREMQPATTKALPFQIPPLGDIDNPYPSPVIFKPQENMAPMETVISVEREIYVTHDP